MCDDQKWYYYECLCILSLFYICINTNINKYFVLYNSDVNECHLNISGCQQICNNTNGNYSCSCISGYNLNSNGLACDGKLSFTAVKICC